ncbi:hypothetical protein DFH09DRAFT_1280723 [Mycena vulgaris]|nr:hypothetical protein DFH09DRAFT_1280723 [Mycena vulgaris]
MDVDDPDGDGEGEGEDLNDGEDVGDGPATIRYINPKVHPALAAVVDLRREVHKRGDKATFVVRHEYTLFMQHAISRLNNPPDDSYSARFFLTGQPGIGKWSAFSLLWFRAHALRRTGKSFGCYYFLFRLLALGQSVFFLNSRTSVYYFSSAGVQKTEKLLDPWPAILRALEDSWVLVDVDDEAEWRCLAIFRNARCVIWTSSLESDMKHFLKNFGAEKWYMKAWSSKEIAAVTERFAIDRDKILKRLDTGGPVARNLFRWVPVPSARSIEDNINSALRGNIFAFPLDDCVFLIQPLVVIDKISGRACLERTDYSAEFLSPHMARRTLELAQNHLKKVQGELTFALDISTTRSVAGKVVEGLMHRALTRGMALPDVFGGGTVARTLELIGKPGSFVCETTITDIRKVCPLYLRPQSLNFSPVDAILVTHKILGLIQTSPGDLHDRDFGTMLRIMSRLLRGAQVDTTRLGEVIFCLVGTVPERVHKLVAEATRTLDWLKELDADELSKALTMRKTKIAHTRLATFRVIGYTFDVKQGFTLVPYAVPMSRV